MQLLIAVSALLGLISILFVVLAVRTYRGRRWAGTAGRTTLALLFASLAALGATLSVSTQGYRALTAEEVAVTITTVPTGPQSFQAFVEFPDGRDTTVAVQGDQLLVDARVLKWRYWANVLGLHTHYELDRLSGRYVGLEDERTRPRTVHGLGTDKPLDLYELIRRYSLLRFLADAEYGSATYVDVNKPARIEIRVSTTGLLAREIPLR